MLIEMAFCRKDESICKFLVHVELQLGGLFNGGGDLLYSNSRTACTQGWIVNNDVDYRRPWASGLHSRLAEVSTALLVLLQVVQIPQALPALSAASF